MGTDAPALDPRIEEVLRDIAADPRARLFTCDIGRLVRGLGQAPVHASVNSAGLTSAERHLLSIGREEVARLLLIAFRKRLEVDQDGSFVYLHKRMSLAEWNSRATAAQRSGFAGSEMRVQLSHRVASGAEVSTGELLAACMRPASDFSFARSDLLSASLMLADRPATRVYLAIELVTSARHRAAQRVLASLFSATPDAAVRHYAQVWHAMILGKTQHPASAADEFVRAANCARSGDGLEKSCRLSLLSALWFAARAGDVVRSRAVELLLQQCPPDAEIDIRFVSHHKALGLRGRVKSVRNSPEVDRELKRFADKAGGITKDVLYVALD